MFLHQECLEKNSLEVIPRKWSPAKKATKWLSKVSGTVVFSSIPLYIAFVVTETWPLLIATLSVTLLTALAGVASSKTPRFEWLTGSTAPEAEVANMLISEYYRLQKATKVVRKYHHAARLAGVSVKDCMEDATTYLCEAAELSKSYESTTPGEPGSPRETARSRHRARYEEKLRLANEIASEISKAANAAEDLQAILEFDTAWLLEAASATQLVNLYELADARKYMETLAGSYKELGMAPEPFECEHCLTRACAHGDDMCAQRELDLQN